MQAIALIGTESASGAPRETSHSVEHLVRLSDQMSQAIATPRVTPGA